MSCLFLLYFACEGGTWINYQSSWRRICRDVASSFHFLCSLVNAWLDCGLILKTYRFHYVLRRTAPPNKWFNNQKKQLTEPTAKLNTYSMPRFLSIIKSEHRMWRLLQDVGHKGVQNICEQLEANRASKHLYCPLHLNKSLALLFMM